MSLVNAVAKPLDAGTIERVLIGGDLSKLNPQERLSYYQAVCQSVGLNPLTRPFEYLTLNNRLILYARKDATDQLRNRDAISVRITAREQVGDVFLVSAQATLPDGRTDESVGAVTVVKLSGADLANAMMKAETKAKRRVTLSICGLGMLDETELDTISPSRPGLTELTAKLTAKRGATPDEDPPEPDGEVRGQLTQDDIPFTR